MRRLHRELASRDRYIQALEAKLRLMAEQLDSLRGRRSTSAPRSMRSAAHNGSDAVSFSQASEHQLRHDAYHEDTASSARSDDTGHVHGRHGGTAPYATASIVSTCYSIGSRAGSAPRLRSTGCSPAAALGGGMAASKATGQAVSGGAFGKRLASGTASSILAAVGVRDAGESVCIISAGSRGMPQKSGGLPRFGTPDRIHRRTGSPASMPFGSDSDKPDWR